MKPHAHERLNKPTQRPPTTGRPNRHPCERDLELSSAGTRVHGDHPDQRNCQTLRRIIDCRPPEKTPPDPVCASPATHPGGHSGATTRHDCAIESFRSRASRDRASERLVFGTIVLSRDAGLRQSRHKQRPPLRFASRARHRDGGLRPDAHRAPRLHIRPERPMSHRPPWSISPSRPSLPKTVPRARPAVRVRPGGSPPTANSL